MPYKTSELPDSDKTPWQEGNPPCPGLWERESSLGGCVLGYWDGNRWYRSSYGNKTADAVSYYERDFYSLIAGKRWRGLNFDPAVGRQ